MTHDHARPGLADHQAVLATARAVLAADPDAAHQAAGSGSCEACTVIAALQLGFTLVAQFTGERMFVSEPLRLQLAAVIDATQQELDASANLAGARPNHPRGELLPDEAFAIKGAGASPLAHPAERVTLAVLVSPL